MYHIRILREAVHDLERLDNPIAHRIVERINWLAANVDEISQEKCKGELADLCKFRIGDYRVLYQILHEENTIVIYQVGHRSGIYRKR